VGDEVAEEDTVEVSGRRMPIRLWEAEIMLRAAGFIVILESLLLVAIIGALFVVAPKRLALLDAETGCSLFMSPFMVLVGLGLLRRNSRARRIMGVLLMVWLIGAVWALLPLVAGRIGGALVTRPRDLMALPLLIFPQLYMTYAILAPVTQRAFAEELKGTSLAPFSSVRSIGRSARAWAAYIAVWITVASVALAVLGSAGYPTL